MSEKCKVARNLIPSNFGFIANVDPTHRLGTRANFLVCVHASTQMVRRIDMSEKSKVAWNLIPSNFGFIGEVDPTHHLGARDESTQIGPSSPPLLLL